MKKDQINIFLTIFAFGLAVWVLVKYAPSACANDKDCLPTPSPLVSLSPSYTPSCTPTPITPSATPEMSFTPSQTAGATATPIISTPTPETNIGTAASANNTPTPQYYSGPTLYPQVGWK